MAGRKSIRRRVASFLELPLDAVLDVARLTWIEDTELLVENHRGLQLYLPGRVVLNAPNGQISINGDALHITALSADQMILLGKIREIRYQT